MLQRGKLRYYYVTTARRRGMAVSLDINQQRPTPDGYAIIKFIIE